jgi:cytosine/uracil/thiamine/allantoin permease
MATGETLNPPAPTDVLSADAVRGSSLYNEDLASVAGERRSWGTYNYAALWVVMSVRLDLNHR